MLCGRFQKTPGCQWPLRHIGRSTSGLPGSGDSTSLHAPQPCYVHQGSARTWLSFTASENSSLRYARHPKIVAEGARWRNGQSDFRFRIAATISEYLKHYLPPIRVQAFECNSRSAGRAGWPFQFEWRLHVQNQQLTVLKGEHYPARSASARY